MASIGLFGLVPIWAIHFTFLTCLMRTLINIRRCVGTECVDAAGQNSLNRQSVVLEGVWMRWRCSPSQTCLVPLTPSFAGGSSFIQEHSEHACSNGRWVTARGNLPRRRKSGERQSDGSLAGPAAIMLQQQTQCGPVWELMQWNSIFPMSSHLPPWPVLAAGLKMWCWLCFSTAGPGIWITL